MLSAAPRGRIRRTPNARAADRFYATNAIDGSRSPHFAQFLNIGVTRIRSFLDPPLLTTARTGESILAARRRPSFTKAYGKTPTVERNGAPGGARVVGHATRTSVTTRSRFGRGARHRSARLREPPASGALRLPALHRQEYESFSSVRLAVACGESLGTKAAALYLKQR
jgi:hypothetical protein